MKMNVQNLKRETLHISNSLGVEYLSS